MGHYDLMVALDIKSFRYDFGKKMVAFDVGTKTLLLIDLTQKFQFHSE